MNENRFSKSIRVVLVGLVSVFGTVSFLALGLEGGSLAPVSYWSFDKQATPVVDDACTNDGMLVGAGAVWTPNGHSDGAISLDGNSHVLVADNDSLDVQLSGGFTLAAWIKPADTSNFPIITKSAGNLLVGSYMFFLRGDNRLLDCYAAQDANNYRGRASSGVFPDDQPDQFHHVACTWDGSDTLDSLHLYIDGVQVDGTTANRTFGVLNAMRDDDTPLKMGTWNDYPGFANGIIDEPVIFDRPLSAVEIGELMAGVATTSCSSPYVIPLKNGKAVVIDL